MLSELLPLAYRDFVGLGAATGVPHALSIYRRYCSTVFSMVWIFACLLL